MYIAKIHETDIPGPNIANKEVGGYFKLELNTNIHNVVIVACI